MSRTSLHARPRASRLGSGRAAHRVKALLAGGLVLGVGGAVTLAAWTDTEWVWGGGGAQGSGDPIGTDSFEIWQSTAADNGVFYDRETNATAGKVEFGLGAISLTPGETIYGWVQLQTKTPSAAASVLLGGATARAGSTANDLFDSLQYQAALVADPASCTAAGIAAGTSLVPAASPLTTAAASPFALAADSGSTETVCFALTLPDTPEIQADDSLRGASVEPAWVFTGTSV